MELLLAYDRLNEVSELIKEFTDGILAHGDDVKQCLRAQNLTHEIENLQQTYALPYGRLYLALSESKAAGCAGLVRTNDAYCEIKRLYVRPAFRGRHLSSAILDQLIQDARQIGYQFIRLDTFPFMDTAIKLYEKYGFFPIARYNNNPAKTALFMQLNL